MAPFRWLDDLTSYAFGALGRSTYTVYVFIFAVFFVTALVLMALGVSLGTFDAWLDSHADKFDSVGTILLRIVSGLVLLLCLFVWFQGIYRRLRPPAPVKLKTGDQPDTPFGWGCLIFAIPVAWFAWFGMTMDYN